MIKPALDGQVYSVHLALTGEYPRRGHPMLNFKRHSRGLRTSIDLARARTILMTFLTALSLPATAQTSANLCEGLPTHKRDVPIERFKKPPFMRYYSDPAFGAKVIRITDSSKGTVHKPLYSTIQAWNADESLILLYRTGLDEAAHVLLDGTTYELVKKLDIVPVDIEEVFWSYQDPDIFYYVSKVYDYYGQFMRYNVKTDKRTLLRDFGKQCTKGHATPGNDVQMHAWDDDLFGFRCVTDDGPIMFSYRISNDSMTIRKSGDGTPWSEWTSPSPTSSGSAFYKDGKVMDSTMENIERTLDQSEVYEHSSLGKTWNGEDAHFQTVFDPSPGGCNGGKSAGVGHLTEFNLERDSCRPIISPDDGWPYTASGTHVSAVAYKKPGWVAMSSVGYGKFAHFNNGKPAPALTSEIYLANTNPNAPTVCRLAQHRSFAKDSETKDYHPYFGEPHASISPSGTRIIFGSDWYDSGSVDTYVIELPPYKRQ